MMGKDADIEAAASPTPRKHLESAMTNRTLTRLLPTLVCCAIIPFTLGGCPPTNNPGNGVGPPLSPDERQAAIDQASDLADSVGPDGDPAKTDQLVTQLRAMPAFSRVDAVEGAIFAQFTDGVAFVLVNTHPASPPVTTPRAKLADQVSGDAASFGLIPIAKPDDDRRSLPIGDPTNLIPESKKAVLINTMGTHYCDPTPTIATWLGDAGYEVTRLEGTFEDVRDKIKGVGVLYYSGHGVIFPEGYLPKAPAPPILKRHFGLWTRTPATKPLLEQYKTELENGELAVIKAHTNRTKGSSECIDKKGAEAGSEEHFLITEAFIRKHWTFSTGALAYLDACYSASPLSPMPEVILGIEENNVNASSYLGWSNMTMDQYSTPSAYFFFDRILGANNYEPIRTPPQRPFSAKSTLAAMRAVTRPNGVPMDTSEVFHPLFPTTQDPMSAQPPRDLPTDFNDTTFYSRLVSSFALGANDVLLRPAIEKMTVAEFQGSTLRIDGTFPETPCTVTVGGEAASVKSQTGARIEADISISANGPVVVAAAERASPPRRLTQWNLNLRRVFMDYPTQGGADCPSCFWEGNIQYSFRGDTAGVRLLPEGPVSPPGFTGGASSGNITVTNAGGTYFIGQGSSITLVPNPDDGAAFIGTCVGFLPTADNNFLGACFFLQGSENRVLFSPTLSAKGVIRNYHGGAYDGIVEPMQVLYSGNAIGNELELQLSPNFNIAAGQKMTGPNSYFEWDAANATSPAEAADAR